MKCRHAGLLSDMGSHVSVVAGQHHAAGDPRLTQRVHRLTGVGLYRIGDDDVSGIDAIDGDMDNRPDVVAGVPLCPDALHKGAVADRHLLPIHHRRDTFACDLLDLLDTAVILLPRVSISERCSNGMSGEALHMGGEVQQMILILCHGVDSIDFEDPLRQRAGLIQHDDPGLGESINVIGTLYQDPLPRGTAYAGEEGERNGDHECAGAGDDEEGEGPVEPGGEVTTEVAREERRDNSKQHRHTHDDRGVDPSKSGDEGLALRLVLSGLLHQLDDP